MGTRLTARSKIEFFEKVFESARSQHISLDEKKLIAMFCIKHASTERKAKEIIKMFETAGEIARFNGEIVHNSQKSEFMTNPLTFQQKLSSVA
jgi:hypothetical protein